MTIVVIERFVAPDSTRRARRLEHIRQRAADALADRTVWCVAVAGAPTGPSRPGVDAARPLPVRLSEQLGATINDDRVAAGVGSRARELSFRELEDGQRLLGREVRPGDVVVLHDPSAAALVEIVRSEGAHAVRRMSRRATPRQGGQGVDAYIVGWGPRGIAAFMSAPGIVSAREMGSGFDGLGWTSVLADVVAEDRDETVGGTLHARPWVPSR